MHLGVPPAPAAAEMPVTPPPATPTEVALAKVPAEDSGGDDAEDDGEDDEEDDEEDEEAQPAAGEAAGEDGEAAVNTAPATRGVPSSTATLKHGIENMLRQAPDPVTQWESYTRLVKDGRSVDDIAATFAALLKPGDKVLLGRKYIENWAVWVVVNVVSVGLFAYKGLWLTVLLYTLFIALSVAGWRAWQRKL